MSKIRNVTIIGLGYVGYSYAYLLAEKGLSVTGIDLVDKTRKIARDGVSIEYSAHLTPEIARATDCFILGLPTNYDTATQTLDCSILDEVIREIRKYSDALIIIKSTVNYGFTEKMNEKWGGVVFSPEFLREGKEIYDCSHPSRIIIGSDFQIDLTPYFELFTGISEVDCKVLSMSSREAELVKLCSNTYLASRVAFFNEVDTFCLKNGLKSEDVIAGMTEDERIGNLYCTPSIGYGGYCLPKDTQATANLFGTPLISSIHESNQQRIKFMALHLTNKFSKLYFNKLNFKNDSDNARESAIIKMIPYAHKYGADIAINEVHKYSIPFLDVKYVSSKPHEYKEVFVNAV